MKGDGGQMPADHFEKGYRVQTPMQKCKETVRNVNKSVNPYCIWLRLAIQFLWEKRGLIAVFAIPVRFFC